MRNRSAFFEAPIKDDHVCSACQVEDPDTEPHMTTTECWVAALFAVVVLGMMVYLGLNEIFDGHIPGFRL